ncbi:MAG: DUF4258 domain-containing protein [Magnetococcales bacterium]|nr:DUF4258 domain-containing protein [Magnetococcales bacterium]
MKHNISLNMEWIKECVSKEKYYFSRHGDVERKKDNLSIQDVEQALLTGIILETYEDTGRGESCLVVGFAKRIIPVHVVCGRLGENMVVVTVYIPTMPKFKTPFARAD